MKRRLVLCAYSYEPLWVATETVNEWCACNLCNIQSIKIKHRWYIGTVSREYKLGKEIWLPNVISERSWTTLKACEENLRLYSLTFTINGKYEKDNPWYLRVDT